MSEHNPSMTPAQQRLLDVIRALPAGPVGEHLEPNETVGYVEGTASEEVARRIDQHLASCASCSEQVDRLQAGLAHWSSPDGKRRMAQLRQRLLGRTPVALPYCVGLLGRKAALTAGQLLEGELLDGRLRYLLAEQKSGDLLVAIGSCDLSLENRRLVLRAGDWQAEVVLRKEAVDQVAADVLVPADVRRHLNADTALEVELAEPPQA